MSEGGGNSSEKKKWRLGGIRAAALVPIGVGLLSRRKKKYPRSRLASVAEVMLQAVREKEKFEDSALHRWYMKRVEASNAERYRVPTGLRLISDVTEEGDIDGMQVFTLNAQGKGDPVIYLHGGAYVGQVGLPHWLFCDRIARQLDAPVTVPVYPLAPNHTFKETFPPLTRLYTEKIAAGRPVTLMGDSAGGGLSAAFCETLPGLELPQPAHLILFSPWVDISMENPLIAAYEENDPMLAAYGLIRMGQAWAGDTDTKDPRLSPLYGDLKIFSRVLIFVGTREILYPDITRFAQLLRESGADVQLEIGEELNHDYPLYPIPEAVEAMKKIVAEIRGSLV